ncbi:MAG: hypothetical protein QOE31_1755 [Solirubrobacteraceae bacterium]|nr:hypothetical protein [Solirubrobacteraceae bacterium]
MRPRCNAGLGFVLAILVAAVAPGLADAANAKYYAITLAPQSLPSGQRSTISATIQNISVNSIGSVNLAAPPNFTVRAATTPRGTAAVVNSTAQLRNLAIPRGRSLVVTLTVDPPCTPVTNAAWVAVAKPPADFKGAALSPPGGRLTTSTTGSCSLAFTVNPADAQVFSAITGTAGDPTGPPVAVRFLDAAAQPVVGRPVAMKLGAAPAGAVLGGTTTATPSGGVALFATLSVSKPGTYTLIASSAGISTTSAPFVADQGLTVCADGVFCNALAITTGSVPGSDPPVAYSNIVTVDAPENPDVAGDGGLLRVSYDVGPDIACAGYTNASPDREVFSGPNRAKTVHSSISGALLAAQGRSADSLRTCILTPYPFSLAAPVGDVTGDGDPDYLGVLPDCADVAGVAPCQVSVIVDEGSNAVVEYVLPPSDLDPIARH